MIRMKNKKGRDKSSLMFEIGEVELINQESDQPLRDKKTSKIKLSLWFGFWALVWH